MIFLRTYSFGIQMTLFSCGVVVFGITLIFGGSVFADETIRTQGILDDIIGGGDGHSVPDKVIDDIENDTGLPNGSIVNDLIPNVISAILAVFAMLLTISALWAGVLFLTQFGDEERVTKARQLLIWSLVGVVATAVSYAYVSGIVNLNWNQ
jgi:hypothetical protein